MAFINKQAVNTQLFKVDNIILTLGIVELFELRLNSFSRFHKLLDCELLSVRSLHIVYATLNIIKLLLQLFVLPFNAHRYFFKLGMTDNHGIIISCGNSTAKLLTVSRFKILLCGNKNIRTRIEPQIL